MKSAHVAAYIEGLAVAKPEGPGLSKPSIKHLAALRMLSAEARKIANMRIRARRSYTTGAAILLRSMSTAR